MVLDSGVFGLSSEGGADLLGSLRLAYASSPLDELTVTPGPTTISAW